MCVINDNYVAPNSVNIDCWYKYCPKCKINAFGNYCNECGTKLVIKPRAKIKCPHCGGTGEIDEPFTSIDPYIWNQQKELLNEQQGYQNTNNDYPDIKIKYEGE